MIVAYNEATWENFLKARFVIFKCQKYVKKGYIDMTKKIYLGTLKRVHQVAPFPTTNWKVAYYQNLKYQNSGVTKLYLKYSFR